MNRGGVALAARNTESVKPPNPANKMERTSQFSFVLGTCKNGIGVFAAEKIKSGVCLRLFGEGAASSVELPIADVPELFLHYCIIRDEGKALCPADFGQMHIGWYLNHSSTPNAARDEKYEWYASADIAAGEEITIDYDSLDEPESRSNPYKNRWR